jgi:rRNA-processing protein Efg1
MAPVRTKDNAKEGEASTSKRKGKQGPTKKQHHHQPKATAIPGKQKIKGALRQARRLLAKVSWSQLTAARCSRPKQDKLAADKRVETERRIKALEAELEQAEQAEKERAMAVRYHKVKFFGEHQETACGALASN